MNDETVNVQLPSGYKVPLSALIYKDFYSEFSKWEWLRFNHIINSGIYFPQIMQFILTITLIIRNDASFGSVLLYNLVGGIGFTVVWFLLKLYRIPGISFTCCLIGGNVFRYYIHFVIIAIVSIFIMEEWIIILFCIIGGVLTQIVKTFLFALFSNSRYNDDVILHVTMLFIKECGEVLR